MSASAATTLRLIRDGTLIGPDGIEIDFRTHDFRVWLTIKGDPGSKGDEAAEAVAAALVAVFGDADA